MMETLIVVLKIIGIALVLLLAVVLLLLFLALFCRVRYDVALDAGETISGKMRFRWLWFVLRFSAVYDDGDTSWVFRVLGIPVKRQKAHKANKTKTSDMFVDKGNTANISKEKAGNTDKGILETEELQDAKLEKSKAGEKEAQIEEISGENGKEKTTGMRENHDVEDRDESGEGEAWEQENMGAETTWKRVSGKFSNVFVKIRGFLLKIKGVFVTIRNIGKKAIEFLKDLPELRTNLKEKKDSVVSFMKDKHVRAFLKLSKTQLGDLLVHLKPTRAQGFIRFGTGDPCSTGQALGVAAMAYPFYASWLRIVPEFEEKHFSGYLKARGKIRLFRVILIGKRWFLADSSKRCLNKWNQLKEELTNGR